MQIEGGRVDIASDLMPELGRRVRLVGAFVLGEAHVAIDAEQRAFGIGEIMCGDAREPGRHVGDQQGHRPHHAFFITRLVCQEPRTLVVGLQLAEEGEEVGG